jgi:toxin ParE1/3/4
MRLIYHPEAELIEVGVFYEARSPSLGERFLRELEAAIAQIEANPDRWEVIENDERCHAMKRFPFGIYYCVRADDLHILAVKHHRRHPDYWRHRLDS